MLSISYHRSRHSLFRTPTIRRVRSRAVELVPNSAILIPTSYLWTLPTLPPTRRGFLRPHPTSSSSSFRRSRTNMSSISPPSSAENPCDHLHQMKPPRQRRPILTAVLGRWVDGLHATRGHFLKHLSYGIWGAGCSFCVEKPAEDCEGGEVLGSDRVDELDLVVTEDGP
ncbi:hypothetical protein GALMADRAFT_1209084 [Galerina marginata CBS 339.88]|uniref:Uncharacterized protein n=1 Tax=Galerina marginata (strain CBS 339.88) TaxID=685588 RepID=A0A067SH76_GALM3|nr:hypothetical protein GALMADRAFT_1209084 [Galerina marginata CBS 339.88]